MWHYALINFKISKAARKREKQELYLELANNDANELISVQPNKARSFLEQCSKDNLTTIFKQLKLNWRGVKIDSLNKYETLTLSNFEQKIGKFRIIIGGE